MTKKELLEILKDYSDNTLIAFAGQFDDCVKKSVSVQKVRIPSLEDEYDQSVIIEKGEAGYSGALEILLLS